MTEAEWQQQVIDLAHVSGWRCNHTRRSIGKGRKWTTATSVVGWPDLELWRPTHKHDGFPQHMYAELKTDRGKLSGEQVVLHASLRAAGLLVYVWHPRDWPDVELVLTAHRRIRSAHT